MDESMRILYFLLILILKFIIIHTQGQDQTTIDRIQVIANDATSVITIPSTSVPTTLITDTISSYTEFTISKKTAIKKATTTTTTLSIDAKTIPSLNPTWIIVGGFAGGLTALGFFAFMISIYICYANSRRRIESSSDISTDQDNIPLYTVSSF